MSTPPPLPQSFSAAAPSDQVPLAPENPAAEAGTHPQSPGPTDQVLIEVVADPHLTLAGWSNAIPLIRNLAITAGEAQLSDLRIRITFSPAIASPWETRLDGLSARTTHQFGTVDLALDPAALAERRERERVRMVVTVSSGNQILGEKVGELYALAPQEWPGLGTLPELLAAFVQPNHPALPPVLRAAAERLKEATGRDALDGYQSKDPARVRAIAAALYEALAAQGITYINPPASFEDQGQKLRGPAEVLGDKLGTCVDLALVQAALVEQVGLHPLLVVIAGHAFSGLWLSDLGFSEPAVDDPALLSKRLRLGELLLYDSSSVVAGTSFEAACALGRAFVEDVERFRVAIDVKRARKHGILPLARTSFPPTSSTPPLPSAGSAASTSPILPAGAPPLPPGAPPLPPGVLPPGAPPLPSGVFPTPPLPGLSSGGPPPLPTLAPDPAAQRIARWKDKLLDLSLRNRFLNFRGGTSSIRFPHVHLAELEDVLAGGNSFDLVPRPTLLEGEDPRDSETLRTRTGEDARVALIRADQAQGILHSDQEQAAHAATLLELYRSSRLALEETGASTLFLALGFLRWYESPSSTEARRAPLLLLPVSLERQALTSTFRLQRTEDEPRVNFTLLKKLEADFGLDGRALHNLPEDAVGVDVEAVLSGFAALVANQPRWDVEDGCALARFSFTKLLMWLDLEARTEALLQSPVVRHVFAGKGERLELAKPVVPFDKLDIERPATEVFGVIDADPSQLQAILAAADGSSFVLQGPPGTGKSQTITNLIAQVLSRGESVLFVAEKQAALEVVERRLNAVGLGPFCLELHSPAVSKKQVFDQFQATLDLAGTRGPTEWEAVSKKLERARGELNAVAALLAEPTPFAGAGLADTTQSLLEGLIRLRDAPELVPAPGAAPDRERLEQGFEQIALTARALATVGDPIAHPLREWGAPRVAQPGAPQLPVEPGELLAGLSAARTAVVSQADILSRTLGLSRVPENPSEWARLEPLLHCLRTAPGIPTDTALRGAGALATELEPQLQLVERAQTTWAPLATRWERSLITEPRLPSLRASFDSWANAFFLFAFFFLYTARGALRRFAKGTLPASPQVASDLAAITQVKETEAAITQYQAQGERLLGPRWQGVSTDTPSVRNVLAHFQSFELALQEAQAAAPGLVTAPTTLRRIYADNTSFLEVLGAWERAQQGWQEHSGQAAGHLGLAPQFWSTLAWNDAGTLIERWTGALSQARAWSRLQTALFGLEQLGWAHLVQAVRKGGIQPEALRPLAERSLLAAEWRRLCAKHPLLQELDGEEQAARIQRFRTVDTSSRQIAREELVARLAARAPGREAPGTEMGVLRRELAKRSRHRPLRRLFAEIPETLRRLKPCVLMSPLSVAQFLDPALPAFDLVIFDEASQIPPWDAIGAIARGRRTVIVGDSRQLPPTAFFSRGEDSEEVPDEEDVVELESVLEEAIAAGVPELRLRWHYRSRHEALISFSNHHYYEGRLHTFPCARPHTPDLGVHLRAIPQGFYDRGGSRANQAEAEALVAELFEQLRQPNRRSVGVVTFSMPQQRLIEDLVEKARAQSPATEWAFADSNPERVFIKNLENVQGDERDVMLFSICYGPDRTGKITMNFGPLNRTGGERRLNVAVTRARELLLVFSTLQPEHIDLRRTRAVGAAHLRTFLDYARRGAVAIDAAVQIHTDAEPESPLEREIRAALREKGWDVDCQVGISGYRIDLGVRHPDQPGAYLAGVECDGAAYHSSRNARERDILRQGVLESLGWTLFRVWSTDWWQDRQGQTERLHAALTERWKNPPPPPVPAIVPAPADPVTLVRPAGPPPLPPRPARAFSLPPIPAGNPDLAIASKSAQSLVIAQLEALHAASPLTRAHVHKLLAEAWSTRQTPRFRETIDNLLPAGGWAMEGETLWARGSSAADFQEYRSAIPGDPRSERSADQIPPCEIGLCAKRVLQDAKSVQREELARLTGNRLGFRTMGARILLAMDEGIASLIARGEAVEKSGRIEIP